jgi:hypothetical protein
MQPSSVPGRAGHTIACLPLSAGTASFPQTEHPSKRESQEIPTSLAATTGQMGSFRKIALREPQTKKPTHLSQQPEPCQLCPKTHKESQIGFVFAKLEPSPPTLHRKKSRDLSPQSPTKWVRIAKSPAPRTGIQKPGLSATPLQPESFQLMPKRPTKNHKLGSFCKILPDLPGRPSRRPLGLFPENDRSVASAHAPICTNPRTQAAKIAICVTQPVVPSLPQRNGKPKIAPIWCHPATRPDWLRFRNLPPTCSKSSKSAICVTRTAIHLCPQRNGKPKGAPIWCHLTAAQPRAPLSKNRVLRHRNTVQTGSFGKMEIHKPGPPSPLPPEARQLCPGNAQRTTNWVRSAKSEPSAGPLHGRNAAICQGRGRAKAI